MNRLQAPESYTRFPRTSGEAFKDASYADPFERHQRADYSPCWWTLLALCGVAATVMAWATR